MHNQVIMKQTGFFITFEGIDGCGKTTQLKLTAKFLSCHRLPILILREPGSTPLSEKTRQILLNRNLKFNALSELLLYEAARAELVQKVIAPELTRGKIIICDRFYDSTTAYQGFGRGLNIDLINRLNRMVVEKNKPDLTFIIDVDYETSLSRRKHQPDRLENEKRKFFNRVRKGFREIARKDKRRVILIDGGQPAEMVFDEIKLWLIKKLKNRLNPDRKRSAAR